MELIIKINMDNAAFEDKQELIEVIEKVKNKIKNEIYNGKVLDSNGNTVGKFGIYK